MTPMTMEPATPAVVTNGAAAVPAPVAADVALERVLALLQAQEERRQDLEEVVRDLLPAVNGTIRLAIGKLDELEKSGVLELLPLAGAALQALKRPSEVAPVRPLQLLRALRDPDVGRGLGVMLEVLRAIGSAAARPGSPSRS